MLNYAIFFLIYSFIGWVCEEVYCSIRQRKFVIRGFLFGPVCPIYGVGAILMVFFLSPYINHWYLLLVVSFISLSVLEYLTSYFMEKIFRMRWWDYSNNKLNINGRVCLLNSTLFTGMSMFLLYILHPLIIKLCDVSLTNVKVIMVIVLYSLLAIDLIASTYSAIKTSANARKYLNAIKEETSIIKEKILNTKFPGFFIRHTLRNFPKIFHLANPIRLSELLAKVKEKYRKEENDTKKEITR